MAISFFGDSHKYIQSASNIGKYAFDYAECLFKYNTSILIPNHVEHDSFQSSIIILDFLGGTIIPPVTIIKFQIFLGGMLFH